MPERGPLETEIFGLWQRATLADPTVHGLAEGRLDVDDLRTLGTDGRAVRDALMASMLGATRESVIRLAREIDALKRAVGGTDEPTDAE